MKLIGTLQINLYAMNTKFQGKIFTSKKVIQLWNFCNFGIPEIIPKSLVTLRFSKISLYELKSICKCFQMRYWPHFYVNPAHSNTYFTKVGIWRVLLQGTVVMETSYRSYSSQDLIEVNRNLIEVDRNLIELDRDLSEALAVEGTTMKVYDDLGIWF